MDYVGVLIERNDGKMLFQLRDNNSNIKNRNCWSLFGGGIKPSEKPIDAAIRELKEELGILIKKEQLKLWMVIGGFNKKNYLYKLTLNLKLKDFKLREGKSMAYFSISKIRKKKNLVKTLRLLLYLYPIISLFKGKSSL